MATYSSSSSSRELPQLIGNSPAVSQLRSEIDYASRCDAKVLITGESGVGKEVVAHLIHGASARRHGRIVTVNCAALTESLLESELFGHVRGSFTGAFRDRMGVLEQANGGTVFMDEIGEMTARMQGVLLRFLETGEIQRVGCERSDARVNVRVIAATNRNLAEAVAEKSFREDLFYRLNVVHLSIPPLRERHEDIVALLSAFLSTYAAHYRLDPPSITPAALEALIAYKWPGNVRELKNVAERLVVRGRSAQIDVADLPQEICRVVSAPPPQPAPTIRSAVDVLYEQLIAERQSFWSAVYAPFMTRDLTRDTLRALVRKGLEQTGGNYRVLTELFNMPPGDYKRFLNFLRKHHCHVAFQPFRSAAPRAEGAGAESGREGEKGRWKGAESAAAPLNSGS